MGLQEWIGIFHIVSLRIECIQNKLQDINTGHRQSFERKPVTFYLISAKTVFKVCFPWLTSRHNSDKIQIEGIVYQRQKASLYSIVLNMLSLNLNMDFL